MEVMLARKKPLSQLCDGLEIYPQELKNIRVKSKPEARKDPEVQAVVDEVAAILGDTGRILVRESGTEPVIRVMVEAATQEICQEYVDAVVDTIKRKGHTV
jgi:phosphoglucosamine mutase